MKQPASVMQGPIYFDEPTDYRIRVNDRPRIVYERRDFNGEFIGFVAYRTRQEINREQNEYAPIVAGRRLPCVVGIRRTWEVAPWEIGL